MVPPPPNSGFFQKVTNMKLIRTAKKDKKVAARAGGKLRQQRLTSNAIDGCVTSVLTLKENLSGTRCLPRVGVVTGRKRTGP